MRFLIIPDLREMTTTGSVGLGTTPALGQVPYSRLTGTRRTGKRIKKIKVIGRRLRVK